MRHWLRRFLMVLSMAVGTAYASAALPQTQTQEPAALTGKMPFASPVALRGMLGDMQVQGTLRNKTEPDEGIEGEYLASDKPQRVLLAGELEGDDFFLEESENGKDVSGQWTGRLVGDTISGEWQSADGRVSKPFTLSIVTGDDKVRSASSAQSSAAGNQQ